MEWSDEAIVIGVRRLGESDVILEALTRAHGRHLGVVRGGRSRRWQPSLQAGNGLNVTWRARLDEQLGMYTVEPMDMRAARFIDDASALYSLSTMGALLRLLPERDPHEALYDTVKIVLDALGDVAMTAPLLVRFELAMLGELGFGLDLTECALTGAREGLVYVSPKTGRAVTEAAGEPWKDRLLSLPAFLVRGRPDDHPTPEEIAAGFALTGHFLETHIFGPRGLEMPESRASFIALAAKST